MRPDPRELIDALLRTAFLAVAVLTLVLVAGHRIAVGPYSAIVAVEGRADATARYERDAELAGRGPEGSRIQESGRARQHPPAGPQ